MKTLNDFFKLYLELYAPSRAEHTIRSKVSAWDRHIKYSIGKEDILKLDFVVYQRFFNALLDKDLAPKTVKNIKNDVSVVVKLAVRQGVIKSNAVDYVELPKFDNRVYLDYSVEEQQRIIRAVLSHNEPIYKNLFVFLLHGRRLSEALNYKFEYIAFEGGKYYLPSHINKSRRALEFGLTDVLREAFEEQKVLRDAISSDIEYVFFNPSTKRRFVDIRKAWRRFKSKNSIEKGFRVHDLRHLVATYSINHLGCSLEKVRDTLGHSSIVTTEGYHTRSANNSQYVVSKIFGSVT